jgi:hypothetical protein
VLASAVQVLEPAVLVLALLSQLAVLASAVLVLEPSFPSLLVLAQGLEVKDQLR